MTPDRGIDGGAVVSLSLGLLRPLERPISSASVLTYARRMSFARTSFAAVPILLIACSPPAPKPPPGLGTETFDGPGDPLSPAERTAFREAANAITPQIQSCIQEGYRVGVHSSEVVARIRLRRDGHVVAVGFKSSPSNEAVAGFLDCIRGAVAGMDLRTGPWEADRNVVYRFTTTVRTTWD